MSIAHVIFLLNKVYSKTYIDLTLSHLAVLQELAVWRRQITTSADRWSSVLVALRNSLQLFEYFVETAVTTGTFSWAFVSPLLPLLLQLSLPPLRLDVVVVAFVFFLLWLWWQHRRLLPSPPLDGDRHLMEDDRSLLLSTEVDFHRFQLLQQHTRYELDGGHSVCVELVDTFGGT